MRAALTVASDVGLYRQSNEDVGLVLRGRNPMSGVLMCIADGMGGHPAGEVASRVAIDHVSRYAERSDALLDMITHEKESALLEVLFELLEGADRTIHELGEHDPSRFGLGTTVVAALIVGDYVHVLNCGDSRAYRLHGEKLEPLTNDHVLVEDGVRYLMQHLGMPEGGELDHGCFEVKVGDRLLLCSDGLTDMLDESEVGAILADASSPNEATVRLIETAKRAGGADNITVAVCFLERGEAETIHRPLIKRTDLEDGDSTEQPPLEA